MTYKQTLKILIAEDDEESLLLLENYFSEFGKCDMVKSGKEAYQAFLKAIEDDFSYDLISLDINMPEMNGHEVLKKIRQKEKKIQDKDSIACKIMMTTASVDADNFIKAMKDNCDAYIGKPVRKNFIKQKLKELNLIS